MHQRRLTKMANKLNPGLDNLRLSQSWVDYFFVITMDEQKFAFCDEIGLSEFKSRVQSRMGRINFFCDIGFGKSEKVAISSQMIT